MEIKRINGVLSAYQTVKKSAAPKTETASSVRNTDRVEFGFETALQAAKNGIAAAVKADAAPQELAQAQQALDSGPRVLYSLRVIKWTKEPRRQ